MGEKELEGGGCRRALGSKCSPGLGEREILANRWPFGVETRSKVVREEQSEE